MVLLVCSYTVCVSDTVCLCDACQQEERAEFLAALQSERSLVDQNTKLAKEIKEFNKCVPPVLV